MGTAKNNHFPLKLPLLDKPKTPKNYAQPEVLCHTFETLSSLHRLLPNHLMEKLYSYKSEEDKQNCTWVEGAVSSFNKHTPYIGTNSCFF